MKKSNLFAYLNLILALNHASNDFSKIYADCLDTDKSETLIRQYADQYRINLAVLQEAETALLKRLRGGMFSTSAYPSTLK